MAKWDQVKFEREHEWYHEQLGELSEERQGVFALRLAIRHFPLLVYGHAIEGRNLWEYWNPNTVFGHLFAVARAPVAALNKLINLQSEHLLTPVDAVAAADRAARRAYDSYVEAASDTSAAAASFACFASAAIAGGSTGYADSAAADATVVMPQLGIYARQDIAFLADHEGRELLAKPLWFTPMPTTIATKWEQCRTFLWTEAQKINTNFSILLNWFDDHYGNKSIDIAQTRLIAEISFEKLTQGPASALAYLHQQSSLSTRWNMKRVRTIFIGNGSSGKTSLVRTLFNENVISGDSDMTPGVEVREWEEAGDGIVAHFWDFGGQVIAHATHRFFLRSQCVYVLVLAARASRNITEDAEYWLEHVATFGDKSPVLIVGNKEDQAPVDLDMLTLKIKYPNIINYYPISCTRAKDEYRHAFEHFKQGLKTQIYEIVAKQDFFKEREFIVLNKIREYSKINPFLSHELFNEWCGNEGIIDEGVMLNRTWFLGFLDNLGVIVRFPQLGFLDKSLVNPFWLTFGVYKLLFGRQATLTDEQISQKLRAHPSEHSQFRFNGDDCRFIADAMEAFKLAFRPELAQPTLAPKIRQPLTIPALLPSSMPNGKLVTSFENSATLSWRLTFEVFVPRHTLVELMVDRQKQIYEGQFCERAVILQAPQTGALAWVEVDYTKRRVQMWVKGEGKREWFHALRSQILQILDDIEINFEESIRLPGDCLTEDNEVRHPIGQQRDKTADWVKFGLLEKYRKHNQHEYIAESGVYDLSALLGLYGTPAGSGMTISINNLNQNGTTVTGDVVVGQEILHSFNRHDRNTPPKNN